MGNRPSPLRRAIRWNDIKKVEDMLDRAGMNDHKLINEDHSPDCILESCTRVQGNAFYYAVGQNRTEIVEIMLKRGADIFTTGQFDETCLHCAARHGNLAIVKLLVMYGLKEHIHMTDDNGMLPVHTAAATIYDTGHVIKYLLYEVGNPEDVNARNFTGRTPLHEAVFMGNLEVVRCLLECGADVNVQSNSGNTPLHGAKRHPAVWKVLVEAGANQRLKNNNGLAPAEMLGQASF